MAPIFHFLMYAMPADEINALHMASLSIVVWVQRQNFKTCINTEHYRHTDPKVKQHWLKSGYTVFLVLS